MKTAIFTVSIGEEFSKLSAISHPWMKDYAKKTGSDFIVCSEIGSCKFPHFQKFEIRKLFQSGYDRVLFIDTDILINPKAPNLFKIVPEDSMGIYDESKMKFLQSNNRLKIWTDAFIERYNEGLKEVGHPPICAPNGWGKVYYNSGVMMCSKSLDIFDPPLFQLKSYGIHDQNYINLLICEKNIKVYPLSESFNWRYLQGNQSKYSQFFVHFNGITNRVAKMKKLKDEIIGRGEK
jgi:lipopolysaccharide biosynthesis glycosyltransferase